MSQILIENLNRKSAPTIRPTTDNRQPTTGIPGPDQLDGRTPSAP